MHILDRSGEKIKDLLATTFSEDVLFAVDGIDLGAILQSLLRLLLVFAAWFIQALVEEYSDRFYANRVLRGELKLIRKRIRLRTIFMDQIGPVTLRSDVYCDAAAKRNDWCVLNELMGLKKGARVDESVKLRLIEAAVDNSYRKSTKLVTGSQVSHTTVMNVIHDRLPPEPPVPEEKKKVPCLYVYADEDHAHLQKPAAGRRSSCQMVPYVTVAEGRRQECRGRYALVNREHFVDVSFDTAALLRRLEGYIYQNYDIGTLEHIYVYGDGAPWITTALDDAFPGQIIHVHDAFHWMKPIGRISRLFPKSKAPQRIKKAMEANEKAEFQRIVNALEKKAPDDKTKKKLADDAGYLLNHWDAIVASRTWNIPGSCSEPMVQHLLSDRFSTRGMGWSQTGLGHLAEWRGYFLNGYNICKPNPDAKERGFHDRFLKQMEHDVVSGTHMWDICDPVPVPFDGSCGTGHRLRQAACGGLAV